MSVKGSCACGEMRFEFNARVLNVVNCHCNSCRSRNGSAFSTYVALPHKALNIVRGEESLKAFRAGAGTKHFCANCGSPLFNLNGKYPGMCMVYLGALENHAEITPRLNIWHESHLTWVDDMPAIRSLPQDQPGR